MRDATQQWLINTYAVDETTRKRAEEELKFAEQDEVFPLDLAALAADQTVVLTIRQVYIRRVAL